MVENSTQDQITVVLQKGNAELFQAKLKGNKLQVTYGKHGVICQNEIAEITVYIPANQVFTDFTLSIGAGSAKIQIPGLRADNAQFTIGAGDLKAERMVIEDRLEVNAGAGNARLYGMQTKDLLIESGVGKCFYEGKVLRNMKAECGVGQVEAELDGKEADYNYNVSCALGTVKINENTTGAFASEKKLQHAGAVGYIELNCGVGKIFVTTKG